LVFLIISLVDSLFEEFDDRRQNNPLRKVSGPFDMVPSSDLNPVAEDEII
jgi:hypothetical protein